MTMVICAWLARRRRSQEESCAPKRDDEENLYQIDSEILFRPASVPPPSVPPFENLVPRFDVWWSLLLEDGGVKASFQLNNIGNSELVSNYSNGSMERAHQFIQVSSFHAYLFLLSSSRIFNFKHYKSKRANRNYFPHK